MKQCPFCAQPNYEDAIVCRHCRRVFPLHLPINHLPAPSKRIEKPKSAWLAVVLNLLPVFGLGFLYLGMERRFAFTLLLQTLGLIAVRSISWSDPVVYFILFLWGFTVYDVYIQTKLHNLRFESAPPKKKS